MGYQSHRLDCAEAAHSVTANLRVHCPNCWFEGEVQPPACWKRFLFRKLTAEPLCPECGHACILAEEYERQVQAPEDPEEGS